MNNNIILSDDIKNNALEQSDFPQARDILINFNNNIYPQIKQKYHPQEWVIKEKSGKKLLELFGIIKKKEITENKQNERSYKELWIQTAQWITDLILGELPTDPAKIELLLQAIWLDMKSIAYWNISLDYSYAADRYWEQGNEIKKNIIKECLKICDEKFRRNVVTLKVTEDSIIYKNVKNWKETVQSKEEFLNNLNK